MESNKKGGCKEMLSLDLNLVWNIINLVVLYLLLSHFLFKPVMGDHG